MESCKGTRVLPETPQIRHTLKLEQSSDCCTFKNYLLFVAYNPHTQLGYYMWVNDLQFKQLTYKHTYCMADHVKVEHKHTIS